MHLLGNMVTLFFFGPPVVAALGVRSFTSLYLASGVASSATHAATARSPRAPALGASGALNAVVAYSILADPFRLILVFAEFFPLPMPALLYGGLFIGRDMAALWSTKLRLPFGLGEQLLDANVAHAAHVGGAVCGAAFYLFRRGRGGGGGTFR
jgi:membrane associated rhomboid family serine protease